MRIQGFSQVPRGFRWSTSPLMPSWNDLLRALLCSCSEQSSWNFFISTTVALEPRVQYGFLTRIHTLHTGWTTWLGKSKTDSNWHDRPTWFSLWFDEWLRENKFGTWEVRDLFYQQSTGSRGMLAISMPYVRVSAIATECPPENLWHCWMLPSTRDWRQTIAKQRSRQQFSNIRAYSKIQPP